ncbi:MAG: transporter substrate-binding domain-containing protein [Oscillospiraceae bacterium]
MKKTLSLILALCMVFALCACGTKAPVTTTTPTGTPAPVEPTATDYSAMTLDELKAVYTTIADGKLTVATSPDFAPYEFYAIDEKGEPVLSGFDMALAQYIADYLGLELEVVPMDFDGVLAELKNCTVDIGLAGLSPDPDRMDAMDFSDIYYKGGQSFVTTVANKDVFKALTDANKADYSIGAQTGSIQQTLAETNTPDADVVLLTKVTDIVAELVSGKLDGAFIETVVAESYAKNYPDLYVAIDVPYDVAGSSVGIAKGNEALVAAINLAIADLLKTDGMDKFVSEANKLAEGEVILGVID